MWHTPPRHCGLYPCPTRLHAPVPVGERHHDVQGGKHQAEVEERVAVGDAILLVVKGPALGGHHLLLLCGLQYGRALLCPQQAVHLPVVGGAQTAGDGGGGGQGCHLRGWAGGQCQGTS